jgi:hypothetical protein
MRVLCFLLFYSALTVHAQFSIVGKILNRKDSLPIENAFIQFGGKSAFSDKGGTFRIQHSSELIEFILIYHPGFNDYKQELVIRSNTEMIFYLKEKEVIENVLEVTSGPEVVFGSDVWNVGDFAWDHRGDLLILTYEEEDRWKRQEDAKKTLFRGGRVLKLDRGVQQMIELNMDQQQYKVLQVPGVTLGFYDQFPGEIIVQCLDRYHLVYQHDLEWDLIPLSDSLMRNQIRPVVDTISKGEFIISDFEPSYPAMDFYLKTGNDWKSFYHISDEREMELFRSEYKYLGPKEKVEAYQFELDHGIDKEIVAAYMRGFQNTHYHSELYAPLLILGDTMMVFDHVHNEVVMMNKKGETLLKQKINYHLAKGLGKWKGKIWKDPISHRLYTAYERSGKMTLLEIFPKSGTYQTLFTLTHSYIQKVRIKGGDIFYIYKPFESTKKRYLFKEKIKHD